MRKMHVQLCVFPMILENNIILWPKHCVYTQPKKNIFQAKMMDTPTENIFSRPKHYMDKRSGHYYFFSGKSHFRGYEVVILDHDT